MTYDFGILRIAPEFLGGYVAYRTASAIRQSPIASDVESIAGLAAIVFCFRCAFEATSSGTGSDVHRRMYVIDLDSYSVTFVLRTLYAHREAVPQLGEEGIGSSTLSLDGGRSLRINSRVPIANASVAIIAIAGKRVRGIGTQAIDFVLRQQLIPERLEQNGLISFTLLP